MSNTPKNTRAAILFEQKKPLLVEQNVLLPSKLQYGQVLVKINYSGICGSQLGEIDGVKGKDNFIPHLLGHEGSGTVVKTGEGVTNVREGDNVVLHWRKGKGIESSCPTYKLKNTKINAGWVTTFNDYAVISENRLTTIEKDFDLMTAPLLGCAITTGFGVIENDANLKIGDSLVIYGSGGLGLSMIQAAKLRGAYPIIAVDKHKNRLDLAQEIGADMIIHSKNISDSGVQIKKILSNHLDIFIDNTGIPEVIELGYNLIHKTGKLVLVGVPRFDENISIHSLPLHYGKTITGSEGGDCYPSIDIPKISILEKERRIDIGKQVTQICLLEDINDAIADMRSGRAKGRIVIDLIN